MSSDTLKTKTAIHYQDRRFLLPTKVYDHKYMQKLHLSQKVKICSYFVLSYEGRIAILIFVSSNIAQNAKPLYTEAEPPRVLY